MAIAVLLHAVAVVVNVIPKIEYQKRKRSENFAFFFEIRLNQEISLPRLKKGMDEVKPYKEKISKLISDIKKITIY